MEKYDAHSVLLSCAFDSGRGAQYVLAYEFISFVTNTSKSDHLDSNCKQ